MAKRKQFELATVYPDDVVSADFGSFEIVRGYYYAHPIYKSIQVDNGMKFVDVTSLVVPRGLRSMRGVKKEKKTAVLGAGSVVKAITKPQGVEKKPKAETKKKPKAKTKNKPKAETKTKPNKEMETSDCELKTDVLDAGSVVKAITKSQGVKKKPKSETKSKLKSEAKSKPKSEAKNKAIGETETSDCELISMHTVSNHRVLRRLRGCTTEGRKTGQLDSDKFEIHIENIWRKLPEERKNEFAYLNSLWFSLHSKRGYKAKVLSWIEKVDIFSKKYVFVPIVHWGHWSLLIFCHFSENSEEKSERRRCMLLLDSLQNAHSKQLEPVIRRFVIDLFKTEERPESKEQIKKLPLLIPKVPQQKDGEECGFFVLYYIDQFLKSDPDNFIFTTGCTHFMKEDWFTPEDVECFVKTLDSTI